MGLTQEQAVALLPIELRSLQNYETGITPIPPQLIPIIATAYGDPSLVYRALQLCEVWRDKLPEVPQIELKQATYALWDTVLTVQEHQRGIIKIMADGQITDNEREEWERVRGILKQLICTSLQVLEASEVAG